MSEMFDPLDQGSEDHPKKKLSDPRRRYKYEVSGVDFSHGCVYGVSVATRKRLFPQYVRSSNLSDSEQTNKRSETFVEPRRKK